MASPSDKIRQAALARGFSAEQVDFLLSNAPSTVKRMAHLGLEQPQYLDMAMKQSDQLRKRAVNNSGFLSSVLNKLGL